MHKAEHVHQIRYLVSEWRKAGERIAFVPTMGNLHAGHLAAVKLAQKYGSKIVVSIFVNPLQFGAHEDFDRYPRTLDSDMTKLRELSTDALFVPGVREIYPGGHNIVTRVEVPGYSDILCGLFRPGHFVGVATVVTKLFNIVSPDIVVLGNKDFQQQLVIRRLVKDLNMPIDIIGLPTVREPDGLAMSSRNHFLSAVERDKATLIYRLLRECGEAIRQGMRDYQVLMNNAMARLREEGFEPDYFEVRSAQDLDVVTAETRDLVILAAAKLGQTRLIDNLEITLPTGV